MWPRLLSLEGQGRSDGELPSTSSLAILSRRERETEIRKTLIALTSLRRKADGKEQVSKLNLPAGSIQNVINDLHPIAIDAASAPPVQISCLCIQQISITPFRR